MLSPEELFKTEYSIMDNEYPEMASHVRRKVIEFAKLCVIEELEKHIEHPTKPGYKRQDIVKRIKELKK